VQSLDLDDVEHCAWEDLRRYIIDEQRADLGDDVARAQIHRFLGYPGERRGDMPLACELMAQGCGLGEDPPRFIHARPSPSRLLAEGASCYSSRSEMISVSRGMSASAFISGSTPRIRQPATSAACGGSDGD
jgi:hypothetical protein